MYVSVRGYVCEEEIHEKRKEKREKRETRRRREQIKKLIHKKKRQIVRRTNSHKSLIDMRYNTEQYDKLNLIE